MAPAELHASHGSRSISDDPGRIRLPATIISEDTEHILRQIQGVCLKSAILPGAHSGRYRLGHPR